MWKIPRKHQYGGSVDGWLRYTCIHCGDKISLSAWQLSDMTTDMATCPKGKPALLEFLMENLIGSGINCFVMPGQENIFQFLFRAFKA